MDPILRTQSLEAFYGDAQALFGIDFELFAGELAAIIGANGAGKSTFLKCLTGLIKVPRQAIHWKGQAMGGLPTGDIVKSGLTMVPEGRRLFPSLTVEENLMMGANAQRKGTWNLARIYKLFPILKEKRTLPSTSLSGGQQQMIAIGRAMMSNPDALLCDELSLGLAPIVIKEIYSAMPEITSEGMTVVIVEQDVAMAKLVSKRLYCFQEGRVSLQGDSHSLTNQEISHAYFGV